MLSVLLSIFAGEPGPSVITSKMSLDYGLVVHIGAVDASLCLGLTANTQTVALAMAKDPDTADRLRKTVADAGRSGQVSVAFPLAQRLPLALTLNNTHL
jgi:hypothetical protein